LKKIVALSIIVVLLCTGCGSSVTVTTEQNDLIAEYVAGVLLKYSFEDEWQYSKIKKVQNGTSTSTTSTVKSSTNTTASKANATNVATTSGNSTISTTASGNSVSTATSGIKPTNSTTSSVSDSTSDPMAMIIEGLGLNGASISYMNYVIGATYPQENLVLCVPASNGQKVVAIEFEISNPTATAIVCNTVTNKLAMKLLINNEAGIPETYTILKNDLINLKNLTIKPGETYKAVAIFMVSDSKASSISSLSISVAINGASAAIKKLV